ncbi:hypothetical protein SG34_033220 [Thalassomonas viridans]|uniref:Uncharacterized protein n=1 Tax=Thalassomonas viridans TaxID=137584 RepID=A0AAE9ZEB2_9GAMM|nr:hypothetical protein [Thalassomonas viridans]WDE08762.1 hypothetical protein SG34_033220 [Thalassomonas viridans]
MNDRKEIKNNLLDMLMEFIDAPLLAKGFKRRKSSTLYKRTLPEGIQEIDFVTSVSPKYQPDAQVHIQPAFILKLPQVSAKALRLVDGNKMLLANAADIILKQPVDICAPKEEHQRWFIRKPDDHVSVGAAIRSFLEKWLYPFVDSLESIGDLLSAYEAADTRLVKQQHWYVFVSAAYLLKSEPEKAKAVMIEHLGNPGLKRRYASVYNHL